MLPVMDLILISGLSGSGKSVALNLLEDAGYYCVDNLPVVMLTVLVRMLKDENILKVAVAIDARSGDGIERLPNKLELLARDQVRHNFLFLYANQETLLKRYSESRRRHPLAAAGQTLAEAIVAERDFVFDVRCLPNPHYDPALRPQTGKDQAVINFLEAEEPVRRMRDDICYFVSTWLPSFIRDNRNYLTVAIGCTGGQHRSVYIAEWLAREFATQARVLVRHRTLDGN